MHKVAWVTGAASGIGRAICELFSAEGAGVAASDVNAPKLEEVTGRIGALGLPFDLADIERYPEYFARVKERFGRLDILVNCGAMNERLDCWKVTPKSMRRTLQVNLEAPFFLSQLCAREMARNRTGRIINISSVNDSKPLVHSPAYSISKAGVRMMTQSMALEFAPYGVLVNSIAPGVIDTPVNDHLRDNPNLQRQLLRQVPLARFGAPQEIAKVALFLATNDASYLTGATLVADGGFSVATGSSPALPPG